MWYFYVINANHFCIQVIFISYISYIWNTVARIICVNIKLTTWIVFIHIAKTKHRSPDNGGAGHMCWLNERYVYQRHMIPCNKAEIILLVTDVENVASSISHDTSRLSAKHFHVRSECPGTPCSHSMLHCKFNDVKLYNVDILYLASIRRERTNVYSRHNQPAKHYETFDSHIYIYIFHFLLFHIICIIWKIMQGYNESGHLRASRKHSVYMVLNEVACYRFKLFSHRPPGDMRLLLIVNIWFTSWIISIQHFQVHLGSGNGLVI